MDINNINSKSIRKTLKQKINSFESQNIDVDLTKSNIFENSMTLSQFKARIGLIICHYIKEYENELRLIIEEISILFIKIKNKNLNYSEIIRILLYTLSEVIDYNSFSNIKLKLVSELDSNSPYFIAYEFNKERINNLTEFSPLFQAYLQLDSYKAYNYIHNRESYCFSMELNFMIKCQLLSLYENFFFVKRADGNEFALLDEKTNVTVINELTLFGKDFNEIDIIKDTKKAYNYAMPLSFHFLHEKRGHYKYTLKNHNIYCPLIYYRRLNIEIEISTCEDCYFGESRLMIENFICDDKNIINEISTNFIFGELLIKEYFDGKDFKKLINAVKNKLPDYSNQNKTNSEISIVNKINSKNNKKRSLPELSSIKRHSDIKFDINNYKRAMMISEEEKKEAFLKYCKYREKKILHREKKIRKINGFLLLKNQ